MHVLIGYGKEVNGYQLYDVEKVRYSRDVKFNKMVFGLEKEPSYIEANSLCEAGYIFIH